MKLKNLTPAPYNPRKITDDQLDRLKKALHEFGDLSGIVFNKQTGNVVGGHQRIKCLPEDTPISKTKLKKPSRTGTVATGVITIDGEDYSYREVDWPERKEKAANLAANKHGGEFNEELLAPLLKELAADENFDMNLTGFESSEIDGLLASLKIEGDDDGEDDVPEVPEEPVTQTGDLYILGKHRLLCGDSTKAEDVEKLMDGKKADMVFTDPPYNIKFQGTLSCTSKNGNIITMKDGYKVPNGQHDEIENDNKISPEFKEFIYLVLDTIKKYCIGGWYICFSSKTLNELLNPLIEKGMKWKSLIVWNKNQSPMGGGHFRKKYEPIAYGYFDNIFHGNLYSEDDVWDISRTIKNDLHPTMKPIALIIKAIEYSSVSLGIVLDLFLGSGSTLIACEKTGRICYGMELSPHYCDVIVKRWEDYTGKKAERFPA